MLMINIYLQAFYLSVEVSSTNVLIGDTILRLLIETGPPFYVAVRATQSSSRLHGKGIASFLRPWVLIRSRELNLRPPDLSAAVKRSTDWANPAAVKITHFTQDHQIPHVSDSRS